MTDRYLTLAQTARRAAMCERTLLKAGADPAWVAKQLGHSNVATTLKIYAHYVPGRKVVTAQILDGQLRNLKQEES